MKVTLRIMKYISAINAFFLLLINAVSFIFPALINVNRSFYALCGIGAIYGVLIIGPIFMLIFAILKIKKEVIFDYNIIQTIIFWTSGLLFIYRLITTTHIPDDVKFILIFLAGALHINAIFYMSCHNLTKRDKIEAD